MAEIYLIRHGETNYLEDNPLLTKKGHEQAKHLAIQLEKFSFDKVYVSTLPRAKQTADYFFKNKNVKVIESDNLVEIYRLIVGGTKKDGTRAGREKEDEERIGKITQQLFNESGTVAVFCHGNVIRYILCKAANISPKEGQQFKTDNCGVSCIQIVDGKTSIEFTNKTF